jgi:DNA-binding MarR family transcriptional regulator
MSKSNQYPIHLARQVTGIKPTEKLVLMILSGYAHNETWVAFPSISTIASMSCLKPRQTQKVLRTLEALGYISRVKNKFGGSNKETTHYKIKREKLLEEGVNKDVTRHTPSPAHKVVTPCTAATNTDVVERTQTINKLNITIEDVENTYGKNWKSEPSIVAKVGAKIGVFSYPAEGNLTYADRIETSLRKNYVA